MNNQKQWNEFLLSQPTQAGIFLQSWEWLEFQKSLGRKVIKLANENVFCGLIEHKLPFGKTYLYAPRGPIVIKDSKDLIKQGIFIRLEPSSIFSKDLQEVKSIQPKQTQILDLSKNDLLSGMHEKTRYNIRLALKKEIQVKQGKIDEFWKLMEQTTERDQFSSHPKEYYEKMLKIDGEMKVKLYMAYSNETPVAGAIIAYFGDTTTYLHGSSSYEHRALMGPYALHWDIIQKAKEQGYKYYDFWGIDEKKWPGVTRFKKGFGGEIVNYLGTFDLPLNKFWYFIYKIVRKIKF